MKNLNILLLIISLSFISCDNQLEETIYSDLLTVNAYETEADAETLIKSVYVNLRGKGYGAYYRYDYLFVSEANTDTYGLDGWSPGTEEIEVGTWDNNNKFIKNLWKGAYNLIGSANFAINILNEMNIDDGVKAGYIAEAKFLRGLGYYDLAFNFGDVILNLGETTGNLGITPQSQVIDQIILDLTEASNTLGSTDSPGRASKGAALGLRAKTYLNAKKWAEAAADAKAVMDLGDYSLMASVEDLFHADNTAANEWMFVLMSTRDGKASSQLPWFSLSLGYLNGGWGRLTLAPDFYDTFEVTDERRSIMANGYQAGNQGIEDNKLIYFAVPGTPEYTALAADPLIALKDINSLPNTRYMTGNDRFVYPNSSYFSNNYPILRYAEILLIRAEALNEVGNTGDAMALVNQIRDRSNATPISGLDQTALRDAILAERGQEFYMEGKRRIDLIRSGKYIQLWQAALESKYPGESFGYLNDDKIMFPIPQFEIDANDQIDN